MKGPLEKPDVFPGVAVGHKPTVAVPTAPEDGQLLLGNLFWGLTLIYLRIRNGFEHRGGPVRFDV